jgi:hypothetical protein
MAPTIRRLASASIRSNQLTEPFSGAWWLSGSRADLAHQLSHTELPVRDNAGSRRRQAGRSFRHSALHSGCRLPVQSSPWNEHLNLERDPCRQRGSQQRLGIDRT